jgi:hypothetical protein
MRNVVELSYDRVQMIRPNVAVLIMHLRAEMSEYDHGGLIGSEKNRPHEQLEMLETLIVVVRVQFQDHYVRKVGYVMGGAEAEVPRVDESHRTVRDLSGGVRENRVPPFEE